VSRALIILRDQRSRERAAKLCMKAWTGTRVEFKAARRTLPQNSKMWAMLTEISGQVIWNGMRLRPEDWKIMFLNGLHRESLVVPSIDGKGYVDLRYNSSDLTKDEMNQLIELITEFGVRHFVKFKDDSHGL